MADDILITFNAGSSTVKVGVFRLDETGPFRIAKGVIDFQHSPLMFHLTEGPEIFDVALSAQLSEDLHEVIDEVFGSLSRHFDYPGW